jgi:uncharacterized protein
MTIARPHPAPMSLGVGWRRRSLRPTQVGIIACAGALALLVGSDGSALWATVRSAVVVLLAAFTWQLARTRRAGGHASTLALGLLATITGAGIGVPHLVKTGISFDSVVGLTALAAGLLLVGASAAGLLRDRSRPKQALGGAGMFLASVLALYVGAMPVAATNVPAADLGGRTPADVGLRYEEVRATTDDGAVLAGWFVPTSNGAAVVLRHGAGTTKASTLDHAAVLARHGYGVLLVDARGHGESSGRAMDLGWFGDSDVRAAVSLLLEQPGVDPERVAGLGLSMGGEELIGALAVEPRLRAVVGEGVTGRAAVDKRWLVDTYGFRGWIQVEIERAQTAVTDLLTSAAPPTALEDAVERTDTPVLLIAAQGVADESRVARRLTQKSGGTVHTWTAPGGHTDGLHTDPATWEEQVTTFLGQVLDA